MTNQIEAPPIADRPSQEITSLPELTEVNYPFSHLQDVPLLTEAVLGNLHMTVRAISRVKVGDVLRTHRAVGVPLDLRVNSVILAAAEVSPQNDKVNMRLVEMCFGPDKTHG